MRILLTLCLLLLWSVQPAQAMCTQSTVMLPDGRMLICMTCCVAPGMCQTTCN